MGKFSAIVCDHCDVRDVLENPPVHNIKTYNLLVYIRADGENSVTALPPKAITDLKAELCESCHKTLSEMVFRQMTQEPRKA